MARAQTNTFPVLRQPGVGVRLRELREQNGLTRAELGDATGVNTSAIVRLEGGHDVRLSTYLPIVGYFADHAPRVWLAAERILLLSPARRGRLIALLERFGPKDNA